MKQEINYVVAPNFLASPQIIQRKEKIQNITRPQHIPAELTKPEICIPLNREQIIEHQWDVEGVPIGGKRNAKEDRQYKPSGRQRGSWFRSSFLLAHIPILFRNKKMRFW